MPNHYWEDENFDWIALDNAMNLIYKIGRVGGLHIWMKEKYGTIRYEMSFAWGWIKGFMWLQNFIFKFAVTFAMIRYKHIAKEIVNDLLSNYIRNKKTYVPWYWKWAIKENPWSLAIKLGDEYD